MKVQLRPLDKFENKITGIALKLVDDKIDPQEAGMDILDAVNEKMMNESFDRRAGIWYDPMQRALEILHESLDEDAFQDMQARMAARADAYLKGRDSAMQQATISPGASEQPEPKERVSLFGEVADKLEEIRRLAIRDNYQLGQEGINQLAEIIKMLKDQEEKVIDQQQGRFKRKGKGRNKGRRRRWGIFSGLGESINRSITEMCDECAEEAFDLATHMQHFRQLMSDFHELEDMLRENGLADVAEMLESKLGELWRWYDKARIETAPEVDEVEDIRRLAGL